MAFVTYLRHGVFEANPIQAGLQVDFEELEADPSRMTISQNIHPANEEVDGGNDGMAAPYDGAQMAGMPPGGAMPEQPPTDEEMQPIEPGMQQPGLQQPPMQQESFMGDDFDLFLDELLEGVNDELTEAPYPWTQQGNAPRNYAGFSGPQQAPPSIAAGGPAAIANWQRQMAAVGQGAGGGGGGGAGGGGRVRPMAPRAPVARRPAAGGPADTVQKPAGPAATPAAYHPPGDDRSAMGSDAAANLGALRGMGLGANRLPPGGIPGFRTGRAAALDPNADPRAGVGRAARILGGNPGEVDPRVGVGRAAQLLNPETNGSRAGANWNAIKNGTMTIPNQPPANPAGGPTQPGAAGVNRADAIRAGQASGGAPAPDPRVGVNRAGAIRAGQASGGAPAAAAAGAEEGGVMGALRGAGNFAARNVAPVARFAGRALPVAAGGIAGAEDYAKTGNAAHAATVGTGTGLGTWGGAGIGAAIGGGLGALGGPAAPITVPLGAMAGGALGGWLGGKGGEAVSRGVADTAFGPGKSAAQTAQAKPVATAAIPPAPTGSNLVPGGALKPAGTPAAPPPTAGSNLVPGGALKTASVQSGPTTQTQSAKRVIPPSHSRLSESKSAQMTWNDYMFLMREDDKAKNSY